MSSKKNDKSSKLRHLSTFFWCCVFGKITVQCVFCVFCFIISMLLLYTFACLCVYSILPSIAFIWSGLLPPHWHTYNEYHKHFMSTAVSIFGFNSILGFLLLCFPLFQALISCLSLFLAIQFSLVKSYSMWFSLLISFSCIIHFNWQVMLASMLLIVN